MKPEVKAHAEYSASQAKRWISCPASIALAKDAPPLPEHPAALEGTLTHECLEAYNVRSGTFGFVTKSLVKLGHPQDRIDRAQRAHLQIMRTRDQYPGAKFYAETKVDTSFFLVPGSFGTVDAAVAELFGRLVVIDFKNGIMPVDPKENYQGICYALGIANEHDFCFDAVEIQIIQPNSRVQSRTNTSWHLPVKKLKTYIPLFQEAVARTKKKNPEVKTGDWCFFCPAKNYNCPAHLGKKREQTRNAFAKVEEEMW